VEHTNITNGNTFPDEVKIDLNMLRALVLDGIGGHVDGADVVAVDKCRTARRSM
jgi:hypothetical protein